MVAQRVSWGREHNMRYSITISFLLENLAFLKHTLVYATLEAFGFST